MASTLAAVQADSVQADSVEAKCVNHEDLRWGEEGQYVALETIKSQCKEGGIAGFFATKDAYKRHCFKIDSSMEPSEFYIQWRGNGNQTLDDDICAEQLEKLVENCATGGQEVLFEWLYLYDDTSCPFFFCSPTLRHQRGSRVFFLLLIIKLFFSAVSGSNSCKKPDSE